VDCRLNGKSPQRRRLSAAKNFRQRPLYCTQRHHRWIDQEKKIHSMRARRHGLAVPAQKFIASTRRCRRYDIEEQVVQKRF
jgi:hypothetical protein